MKLLKVLAICLLPISSYGQYLEMGIFGGASNYLGDLAPTVFTPSETHPALGGFVKFNANRFIGFRLGVNHGTISGDDSKHDEQRQLRNLSFKSTLTEVNLMAEINLFGFEPRGLQRRFSPYIFGGIALFKYNPKALYNGQWVALQPLGTEGQGTSSYPDRTRYQLTQISLPLGAGIKFAMTPKWTLGLEVGLRKTFTDYLDDVSSTYIPSDILIAESGSLTYALSNRTGEYLNSEPVDYDDTNLRGDPNDKDWYMFGGITLSRNFVSSGRKSTCFSF
jgi:hypothetical protein